ncbi:hypothetical protein BDW02DRAFT_569412 [Decorospora gaudefroyi]|uniref:Uncharacterized protein n=1 Tax=Decorospora gaudefroyi TaxID=184978 RepID=A0A6A5KD04_9PLEO|nr:hypothetical protein BDW02DRAFT_569412 [Decorospora gaudefroyi]
MVMVYCYTGGQLAAWLRDGVDSAFYLYTSIHIGKCTTNLSTGLESTSQTRLFSGLRPSGLRVRPEVDALQQTPGEMARARASRERQRLARSPERYRPGASAPSWTARSPGVQKPRSAVECTTPADDEIFLR